MPEHKLDLHSSRGSAFSRVAACRISQVCFLMSSDSSKHGCTVGSWFTRFRLSLHVWHGVMHRRSCTSCAKYSHRIIG